MNREGVFAETAQRAAERALRKAKLPEKHLEDALNLLDKQGRA